MDQIANILGYQKRSDKDQNQDKTDLDTINIDDSFLAAPDDGDAHSNTPSSIFVSKDPTPNEDKETKNESPADTSDQSVLDHEAKLEEVRHKLMSLKHQIEDILDELDSPAAQDFKKTIRKPIAAPDLSSQHGENVLTGVFNGEKMITQDAKEYAVAPNYASKSKLVEGDVLKLTIKPDGRFLYKQVGPIQRKRIIGTLEFKEDTDKWMVRAEGNVYKILTASVTFYKGKPGDEVIAFVPEDATSSWAAVDNIIAS